MRWMLLIALSITVAGCRKTIREARAPSSAEAVAPVTAVPST